MFNSALNDRGVMVRPGSAPPGARPSPRTRRVPQGSASGHIRPDSKAKQLSNAAPGPVSWTQINRLLEQCCIVDDRPLSAGSASAGRPSSGRPDSAEQASTCAPGDECPCCKELLEGFSKKLNAEVKVLRQDFASAVAQMRNGPQVTSELESLRAEMREFFTESLKLNSLTQAKFKDVTTEIRKSKVDMTPVLEKINSIASSVDPDRLDGRILTQILSPIITQNKEMLETLTTQIDQISVDLTPVLDGIAKLDAQQASAASVNEVLTDLKTSVVCKEDLTPVTEHLALLQSSSGDVAQSVAKIQDQIPSIVQETSSLNMAIEKKFESILFESMAFSQQSESKRLDEQLQPILARIDAFVELTQLESSPKEAVPPVDQGKERAPSKSTTGLPHLQRLVEQILEQTSRLTSNSSEGPAGISDQVLEKLNALEKSCDLSPVLDRMSQLQATVVEWDVKGSIEQVSEAISGIDLYSIEQKVEGVEDTLKHLHDRAMQTPKTGSDQVFDIAPLVQKIDDFQASTEESLSRIEAQLESPRPGMRSRSGSKEIRRSVSRADISEDLPAVTGQTGQTGLGPPLTERAASGSGSENMPAFDQEQLWDALAAIETKLHDVEQAVLAQDKTEGMDPSVLKEALQGVNIGVDLSGVMEEINKIKVKGLNPEMVLDRIEDLKLMQREHTEKMWEQWFTPVMHKVQCIEQSQNDMRNIIAEKLEKSLDLSPVLDAVRSADNNGLARYNETVKEVRRIKIKDDDFKTVMHNINEVKQKFDLNFKPLFHRIDNLKLDPDLKPVVTRIDKMEKAVLAKKPDIDFGPVLKALGTLDIKGGHQELLDEIQKISFGAGDFKPILEKVDALEKKLDFAPILEQINHLSADEDVIVEKINAIREDMVAQRDAMAAVDLSPVLKAISKIDVEGMKKQMKAIESVITSGTGPEGGAGNRGTAAASLTIWPALGYSVTNYKGAE